MVNNFLGVHYGNFKFFEKSNLQKIFFNISFFNTYFIKFLMTLLSLFCDISSTVKYRNITRYSATWVFSSATQNSGIWNEASFHSQRYVTPVNYLYLHDFLPHFFFLLTKQTTKFFRSNNFPTHKQYIRTSSSWKI